MSANNCKLLCEGRSRSIFYNPENDRTSSVPRQLEVNDFLTRKICRDLAIKEVKA